MANRKLRIRKCDGNKAAWLLVRLNDDGTESHSFGSFATALSLDHFWKYPSHLTPRPGDVVELVPC